MLVFAMIVFFTFQIGRQWFWHWGWSGCSSGDHSDYCGSGYGGFLCQKPIWIQR